MRLLDGTRVMKGRHHQWRCGFTVLKDRLCECEYLNFWGEQTRVKILLVPKLNEVFLFLYILKT